MSILLIVVLAPCGGVGKRMRHGFLPSAELESWWVVEGFVNPSLACSRRIPLDGMPKMLLATQVSGGLLPRKTRQQSIAPVLKWEVPCEMSAASFG